MKKRLVRKIEDCLTWMMLSGLLILNIWLFITGYYELVPLRIAGILSIGMVGILSIVRIWQYVVDDKR